MNVFKNTLLFFLSFLSAFLIWSVADMFLPKTPPIFIPQKSENLFFKINLTDKFFPAITKTKNKTLKHIQSLKGIKLKAVYSSKNKSFIIIEKNSKTYFINLGEIFEGYKLIKITPQSAIFEKNKKKYEISFEKIKSFKNISNFNEKETFKIDKKTLKFYKSHFSKIWQNISIIKTPEGYKITYIKPKSIFDKIGLKRGDIILEINNIPLKNDENAWKIYNQIENYPQVEIVIKRNFQIKVLRYELD